MILELQVKISILLGLGISGVPIAEARKLPIFPFTGSTTTSDLLLR